MNQVGLDMDGDRVTVRLPYDPALIARVKSISPRPRWDGDRKRWLAPLEAGPTLLAAFPNSWVSKELLRAIDSYKPLVLPEDTHHPPEMLCKLFPHQRTAIQALRPLRCALLADEPGVGKSRAAIGWAIAWRDGRRHEVQSCPVITKPLGNKSLHREGVLIVCPATIKYFYASEILAALPNDKVVVVEGRAGDFPKPGEADWVILNYDLLSQRQTKEDGIETRLSQIRRFGFAAVIFSEAHRMKAGRKSLRGQAGLEIAQMVPAKICETGTPNPNRPIELFPLLVILEKQSWGDFIPWGIRYAAGHKKRIGKKEVWDFSGASNLGELADRMAPYTVRRRKADVLKDLPPVTFSFPLLELSNRAEYEAAESELFDLVTELRENLQLPEDERQELMGKILGQRTKLLMICAKGKVESVKDLLGDYLASEQKVVVFSEFLEPIRTLYKAFPDVSIPLLGELDGREDAIQRFQNDPSLLFALASRRAFGYAATLTAASTVIFCSLPWGPADWEQAYQRCHRIGTKSNVEAISLVARHSIDSAIAKLLYRKAEILNTVWDAGDLALIEKYGAMLEALHGN